jgi:hypothetical protein
LWCPERRVFFRKRCPLVPSVSSRRNLLAALTACSTASWICFLYHDPSACLISYLRNYSLPFSRVYVLGSGTGQTTRFKGSTYSITPIVRINWDREPSGYAENPDNLIFLWK